MGAAFALLQLGWYNAILPMLLSAFVTLACTVLFLIIRWLRGVGFSTGTDLFAVLLAADVCVVLGTVEVWRLSEAGLSIDIFRMIAACLGAATISLCWLALSYERTANKIYAEARHGTRASTALAMMKNDYLSNYSKAYVVRWLTATLHLWWITKLPRWWLFT
jgi:hypothetical protein